MEKIIVNFKVYILIAWMYCPCLGNQQCSQESKKTLTKIPHLLESDIGVCDDDITDYSTYLTSLLDGCTFSSVASITSYSKCHAQCVTDDTCVALTFSRTNGCEHCIEMAGSGNGNSYAQADVMVAAEALKIYINGDMNSWNLLLV